MHAADDAELLGGVVPFCDVTTQVINWLWVNHLAFGKLAMLDGDPDQGKSYVALDLCARLSTGRPMPDGSPSAGVIPSLVLQAEDAAEDTTRPRLEALGADLALVHTWRDLYGTVPLQLPDGAKILGQALTKTRARFVVLDPVMAYLDQNVAANSDQGVRHALAPLVHLCHERGVAAMLVRHLNKHGGGRALYRGGGSIGLLAVCRSGWLIGADPMLPTRRVLAPVKNNLAGLQLSLSYELVLQPVGPPTVVWHGPSLWSADQVLIAAESLQRSPELNRACQFLANFLRDGPQQLHVIWAAAEREGISDKTMRRARRKLGVRTVRPYRNGVRLAFWLLPFHEPPVIEANEPPSPDPELDRFFEEQEKLYPPICPLDRD